MSPLFQESGIDGLITCLLLHLLKSFTGSHPFSELAPADAVFKMVINCELPDRPQEPDLTDPVWDMTLRCWQHEPDLRPTMTEVVATLRERQVFLSLGHEYCDMTCFNSYSHRSFISAAQPLTDSEPSAPSSSRPVHHTSTHLMAPAPYTGPRELAAPSFEDACRRIDQVAEVIQPSVSCPRSDPSIKELATGRHRSRERGIIELLELCGRWCTVPRSYTLQGVVKEGQYAQHVSQTTEIWKGRYKEGYVALKILRGLRDDPLSHKAQSVSAFGDSRARVFSVLY